MALRVLVTGEAVVRVVPAVGAAVATQAVVETVGQVLVSVADVVADAVGSGSVSNTTLQKGAAFR